MVNIWGYKNRLKKSRDFLKQADMELNIEKMKRGNRRDNGKIEWWENHIGHIKGGQKILRDKIKILKQTRKKTQFKK